MTGLAQLLHRCGHQRPRMRARPKWEAQKIQRPPLLWQQDFFRATQAGRASLLSLFSRHPSLPLQPYLRKPGGSTTVRAVLSKLASAKPVPGPTTSPAQSVRSLHHPSAPCASGDAKPPRPSRSSKLNSAGAVEAGFCSSEGRQRLSWSTETMLRLTSLLTLQLDFSLALLTRCFSLNDLILYPCKQQLTEHVLILLPLYDFTSHQHFSCGSRPCFFKAFKAKNHVGLAETLRAQLLRSAEGWPELRRHGSAQPDTPGLTRRWAAAAQEAQRP